MFAARVRLNENNFDAAEPLLEQAYSIQPENLLQNARSHYGPERGLTARHYLLLESRSSLLETLKCFTICPERTD